MKWEILKKKKNLENFSKNENFYFAKIQDRMYEKHESYGVLKLSKQALQKGNVGFLALELFGTLKNRSKWFRTEPNGSNQFWDSRNRGRYFQQIIMVFPNGSLLTGCRKPINRTQKEFPIDYPYDDPNEFHIPGWAINSLYAESIYRQFF